jgi:hypothetical protein
MCHTLQFSKTFTDHILGSRQCASAVDLREDKTCVCNLKHETDNINNFILIFFLKILQF